jgi:hypothetical protein
LKRFDVLVRLPGYAVHAAELLLLRSISGRAAAVANRGVNIDPDEVE